MKASIMGLLLILLSTASAQEKTVAIRFGGDSTVNRYAAEELQRYLSYVSDHQFILRDSSLSTWIPEHLTQDFPECLARAQKAVKARAANPDYEDPEMDRATKARFEREKSLPAFVLGTVANYPEYAAQLAPLLKGLREGSDGYAIAASSDGNKLFITSHTERGVLYGVYHYLQNVCGMGFFEDGEYVPQEIDESLLPPFEKNPDALLEEPKHDYRGQWLWSRYYGSDKGHPANWGYDEWVSHLRWMAQNRFSSAMLHASGYTRLWGDVFKRAFPEVAPFDDEVFDDIDDFWGAHWSPRAGWGRSPEETTRLMQKVLAFGREKLGMQFEYTFLLGDFEDTLLKAYPEGRWIDWSNVPHHTYFGAAGRTATLSFTDPKCKEYSQRLWKEFFNTFGTDSRYWITYREESKPDSDDPFDPDQGKSLADAVNAQRDWLLEIDPDAEFYQWDWHDMKVWLTKDIHQQVLTQGADTVPIEKLEASTQKYSKSIDDEITFVSVISPGSVPVELPDLTHHYAPHPWVIGSLLGYAMQDIGFGGISIPIDQFFANWKRLVAEDARLGSRLRGVLHWNEIIQASPLLDYVVANFAWTDTLPESLYDAGAPDDVLDWYFEHRYGPSDAQVMREVSAVSCSTFKRGVPSMRIPTWHTRQGISKADKARREALISALRKMVSIKARQGGSTAYRGELLDFGRIALHGIARLDLQEAIEITAKSTGSAQSKEAFEISGKRATDSLTALADLLATDQRYSVRDTLYRMLNEPGVNRQMRLMVLEQASGLFFSNYALNDSAEFVELVSVPLLSAYLESMRLTVDDPGEYPFATLKDVEVIDGVGVLRKDKVEVADGRVPPSTGIKKVELDLKNDFMELPAVPFSRIKNPKHPADVLSEWLKTRD